MGSVVRWAWRHRRAIAGTTAVAAAGYGAYTLWRKKRELEELVQSLGLQDLFGGESSGAGRAAREARCVRARTRMASARGQVGHG
jgi:hypothetical protein